MKTLLVLRPEPEASKTAEKARALGLTPLVKPLFEARPLPWDVDPAINYDALFITSANALIFNTKVHSTLLSLPALCVGEASAAAARSAGFSDVTAGNSDAQSLADLATALGYRHLLWLCGRPSGAFDHPNLRIDVKFTYEMLALEWAEKDREALKGPLIALLHSPRAAQKLSELVPDKQQVEIVAISGKTANAAGPGWAGVHWPAMPSSDGMLEIAAPLCRAG